MPKSVLHVIVIKGQGLGSGILFFTSLVLLPKESVGEGQKLLFEKLVTYISIWPLD